MLNWTSCPVSGPLPPVVWRGLGWIPPGCTLLRAVKVAANTLVLKINEFAPLSRVSKATSEGEFARVGTLGVRAVFESRGKTRRSEEHTSELQSRENIVCR